MFQGVLPSFTKVDVAARFLIHESRKPYAVDPTVTSVLVGACIGGPSGRLNHRTIDVAGKICCNKEDNDENDRFRSKSWQGYACSMLGDEVW